MADTTQTLGLVTLAQNYRAEVVRQINRRSALLRTLRIVRGEGKNVALVTESSGQLAENYSEGADAANFGSDAQAAAVLSWGQYRANFHVSGLAMSAAASSMTPEGNLRLWARNLLNASSALAATLNTALFSGPGTGTTIAGLDVAIGSTSNTYAGIDRSSNSYWRPYVVDPGVATALTLAQIRTDLASIYEQCGMVPDVAVCEPAVFNKVVGLFDATRRQVDMVMSPRGAIRLDAGYQAVEVDGCLFVRDKDATDGQIYYLNSDAVEIQYLQKQALPQGFGQIQADDGFGPMPLGFAYEMLAKNGDSDRAMVTTYLQLCVHRPNACGIRKNVSTT